MTDISGICEQVEGSGKSIFDGMPRDKYLQLMQMCGPCGCWQNAGRAYDTITDSVEKLTESQRLIRVGVFAESSLSAFGRCMEMLGKNLEDTLATMDATSKWLVEKGWDGLPAPENAHGYRVRKTARQLYDDMVRFRDAWYEYRTAEKRRQEMIGR